MNIGAVALVAVVCTSVAAEPVRKQGPTKEQAFPDDSATCEPAELESPVKGWSFYKVKDFRSESTYLVEDKTKEMLAELVSNELDAEGNEKPGGKSTHSAAELSVTL
ncbi:MAG TPA: hypothetical protein VIV58_33755, partial [Kofleriaceae bacterium]